MWPFGHQLKYTTLLGRVNSSPGVADSLLPPSSVLPPGCIPGVPSSSLWWVQACRAGRPESCPHNLGLHVENQGRCLLDSQGLGSFSHKNGPLRVASQQLVLSEVSDLRGEPSLGLAASWCLGNEAKLRGMPPTGAAAASHSKHRPSIAQASGSSRSGKSGYLPEVTQLLNVGS